MDKDRIDIYLLMGSRVSRSLAAGFMSVIIGIYYLYIGLNIIQVGILFAIGAFINPLFSLLFSVNADKYGRKPFLLLSTSFLPISLVILLFTRYFPLLALSAALGGFGIAGGLIGGGIGAIVAPIQTAILAEKTKKEELTKIYSLFTTISTYSGAAGAVLAGINDYRILFLLGILLSALSFIFVIPVSEKKSSDLKEKPVEINTNSKNSRNGDNNRNRDIIKKFTYTGLFNGLSQGLIVPFIPIVFEKFYNLPQAEIGYIVSLSGIVSASLILLTPKLNERLGFVRLIIYTRLVSTILTLVFPFLRYDLLAALDYTIFTSFRAISLPAQQALMMSLVSSNRRATTSGTNQTAR